MDEDEPLVDEGAGGQPPMKRCPDCAELVQPDARICRYCRHNFEVGVSAGDYSPEVPDATELPDRGRTIPRPPPPRVEDHAHENSAATVKDGTEAPGSTDTTFEPRSWRSCVQAAFVAESRWWDRFTLGRRLPRGLAVFLGAVILAGASIAGLQAVSSGGGGKTPGFPVGSDSDISHSDEWDVSGVFAALNQSDVARYLSGVLPSRCFMQVSATKVRIWGYRGTPGESGYFEGAFVVNRDGDEWVVAGPYPLEGPYDPLPGGISAMPSCAVDSDGFVYGYSMPLTYPQQVRTDLNSKLGAALSAVNSSGVVQDLVRYAGGQSCFAHTAADTATVDFEVSHFSDASADSYGIAWFEGGTVRMAEGTGYIPTAINKYWSPDSHPYLTIVRCDIRDGKLTLKGDNADYLVADAPRSQDTAEGAAESSPTTTAPEQAIPTPTPDTSRTELFQTPSGNVSCLMQSGFIRCDIHSGFKPIPPRARLREGSCLEDYGDWPPHAVTMGATGGATVDCPTDAVFGDPVLAYGRTLRSGPFTCVSKFIGLTCKNKEGHGFFLSRERSTLLVPGSSGKASQQVVIATDNYSYVDPYDPRNLVRPKAIVFGPHDSIYQLRWSSWGGSDAKASGVESTKNCNPSCADDDSYSTVPVEVVALDRQTCANGVTAYTRLRVTEKGKPPWVADLFCR